MVSVIIPVYNEENNIVDCLKSLLTQTVKPIEIIVVDDGSTDSSKSKVQSLKSESEFKSLKIFSQAHKGPGMARNLGARQASGNILVFVDSDMTFDEKFVENLIDPIEKGEAKGTFSKEEYVSNWNNVWARCWNYNEGISDRRRVPEDHPRESPVFRAILRSEFEKVNGFDDIGFTDDWTLSQKLGYKAQVAQGAICYHENPQNLIEVYIQARWIGKNEFIVGSMVRKLASLIRYNPFVQFFRAVLLYLYYKEPAFPIFSIVYYCGIYVSICLSFFNESKSK